MFILPNIGDAEWGIKAVKKIILLGSKVIQFGIYINYWKVISKIALQFYIIISSLPIPFRS